MAIKRKSGKTKLLHLPKASQVAITPNTVMKFNNIGGVIIAVSDTNERLVGVSRDSWATSDTTKRLIAVEVPIEKYVEWEIDTDSDGGLTDTMIGTLRDLDTLGANLDASATTDGVFLVTGVISATKGVGVLVRLMDNGFVPITAST